MRNTLLTIASLAISLGGTGSRADSLDLGDMAVGGDGTGTGIVGAGVRLADAAIVDPNTCGSSWNGPYFTLAPDLPYVDGVFLPDGTTQVDSEETTFGFPLTSAGSYDAIRNAGAVYECQFGDNGFLRPIQLADQLGVDRPGLGMHSNKGITFDLDAVRAAGHQPRAVEGVAGLGTDNTGGSVEIWILLDGELQFHEEFLGEGTRYAPFSIRLSSDERFITFVCTDYNSSRYADHGVIADAVLLTGCVADLDGDYDVDLADLAQLLGGYGMTSGASYADGDIDGDGDVSLDDLATLLGEYGTTCE